MKVVPVHDSPHLYSVLARRAHELSGRYAGLCADVGKDEDAGAVLGYKMSLAPDVTSGLDFILKVAQERTLGRYENLLTSISQDVLGEQVSIELEAGMARGKPTLKIFAINDGCKESIYDGRGGSLANVLSAGLRYIVLTRMTGLRQFIVLDEPDCWIRPSTVPKFTRIISQMSKDMGVQSLCVSHHSASFFPGDNIIKLAIDPARNTVYVDEDGVPAQWQPEQVGIRSIALVNFMSHRYTKINLSPFNNVVTGDNDIGKSAVVRAIRAVAYNEGSEDMIRHGENQCEVVIALEEKQFLQWTRRRGGAAKTAYALLDEFGETIRETKTGSGCPKWAEDLLGIQRVDGHDLQVGHQKEPLFIIRENPSKTASLLSIGKDTQYIQSMFAAYGKQVAKDKKELKAITMSIAEKKHRIKQLEEVLPNLSQSVDEAHAMHARLQSNKLGLERIMQVIEGVSDQGVDKVKRVAEPLLGDLEPLTHDIKLSQFTDPKQVRMVRETCLCEIDGIRNCAESIGDNAPEKVTNIDLPGMNPVSRLHKVALKCSLETLKQVATNPAEPNMRKTRALMGNYNNITLAMEDVRTHSSEREKLEKLVEKSEKAMLDQAKHNGVCILCGN